MLHTTQAFRQARREACRSPGATRTQVQPVHCYVPGMVLPFFASLGWAGVGSGALASSSSPSSGPLAMSAFSSNKSQCRKTCTLEVNEHSSPGLRSPLPFADIGKQPDSGTRRSHDGPRTVAMDKHGMDLQPESYQLLLVLRTFSWPCVCGVAYQ